MTPAYDFLTTALDLTSRALKAINPWGALAASTLTAASIVSSATKDGFLAPSIRIVPSYRDTTVTLLLRNFEAIAVDKFINLRIEWASGWSLEKVQFRAGPWLHQEQGPPNMVHVEPTVGRPSAVILRFNGLPADGAVVALLTFDRPVVASTVSYRLGRLPDQRDDNALRLRRLVTMAPFSRSFAFFYYARRLGLGLALYLAGAAYLFPAGDAPTAVDAAVAVGGVVLVALAWFVALPMQGKDTVVGFPIDATWIPPWLPAPTKASGVVADEGTLDQTG